MNCEWVKSQVTLYAFDELSDPDRVEVEHHLARCEECARAAEAEKELRRLMNLRPRLEPSPALLAECRMALSEGLEALPPRAPWAAWLRLLTDPFSGIQVQWKAGLALFLVSLGFSGGWFWARRAALPGGEAAAEINEANISNISSITPSPDGRLQITLDTTRRRVVTGRPDEPGVERLLVYALRNYYNSGIRLDTIDLLKNRTQDSQIRSALISALRTDKNPGVRLKALEALRGFEGDTEVRKMLLDVLLRDNNPGVRIEAIEQLVKRQDATTTHTLQRLAEEDPNNYIRLKSASTLRAMNLPVETY